MVKISFRTIILSALCVVAFSCHSPLDWPESPLYEFDEGDLVGVYPEDLNEIKKQLVGHYAHYDVVAYEDTTTKTTMRSFIISYGFTEFFLEGDKLIQSDRFVYANQQMSRENASSQLSREAVEAIKPRVQEVDLTYKDGKWLMYRPPTPSLLGIDGDPSKPLSKNPKDPLLTDPDNDGHPGVTVKIEVGDFFSGEIYIIRREIFSNYLQLNADGTLTGHVIDESEQFVVGASKKILAQPSNSIQHPDPGLNPVLLVPVDPKIDTYEELMEIRDSIFPKEPEFYSSEK